MIHDRASEAEMVAHARKDSKSILDDGRDKILSGITSVEEVMRVTHEG